jgi:hypothetical protein
MNAPSGNDPENLAREELSRACRSIDKSNRLRWVLLVCQILLAMVLALALIDYWLILPTSGVRPRVSVGCAVVLESRARCVFICAPPISNRAP